MNYEKDGIEIISGVFTKEEVEAMKAGAFEVLEKKNPAYKHDFIEYTKKGTPSISFWPSLISPVLEKARTDERLRKIVKKYLGEDVKQLNNQVYYRQAGDEDEFGWHQDIIFRSPREDHPGIAQGYLQTIIALDDITEENGAIEFIPGSHRWGEKEEFSKLSRTFERNGYEGVKYSMKAGDVAIWSCLTVHGSERNVSKGSRMTFMNGFAKAECAKRWPLYMRSGRIQLLEPSKIL